MFGSIPPKSNPASLVSMTNLQNIMADYTLSVGESIEFNYTNVTSLPLRIATIPTGGVYEVIIVGGTLLNGGYTTNAVTFVPNNGVGVGSTTIQWGQVGSALASGSASGGGVASTSSAQIGQGVIGLARYLFTTFTIAKSMIGQATWCDTTNPSMFNYAFQWFDTTTLWTSLGTITFPVAQSGTVIIKRIL